MLLQAFFCLLSWSESAWGPVIVLVYFSVGLHAGSGVFQTSCSLRDLGVYGVSQHSGSLVGVTTFMEATI